MNVFIIHGAYGNPNENWFPWLKKELESRCHHVIVPVFPTPENQDLEEWMKVFEPYMDKINKDTIFIGHSLGVAFILSILEKLTTKVKACFFVSGFIGMLDNEKFDEINSSFTNKAFNWKKIKENCNTLHMYHSNNDPYVPLEKAEELSKNIEGDLVIIKGAGHFNSDSGYIQFKRLLEDIEELK
jgi:predicted alpha/beta hydrolase family esterase